MNEDVKALRRALREEIITFLETNDDLPSLLERGSWLSLEDANFADFANAPDVQAAVLEIARNVAQLIDRETIRQAFSEKDWERVVHWALSEPDFQDRVSEVLFPTTEVPLKWASPGKYVEYPSDGTILGSERRSRLLVLDERHPDEDLIACVHHTHHIMWLTPDTTVLATHVLTFYLDDIDVMQKFTWKMKHLDDKHGECLRTASGFVDESGEHHDVRGIADIHITNVWPMDD